MKKLLASFVFIVMLAPEAFATGMGGFYDGTYNVTTVKQAKTMPDDSYVTLKGSITQRLTSDEYTFKDSTGTITVEIDAEKWMGQIAGPNDLMEITGEIDKDFRATKIDVDSVKVLPKK